MPMLEVLEVSNGTDTVSFLNEGSGFVLDSWFPKITQPKEGGIYKDSSLADGRQLAMIRYANVQEEFTLKITGSNPNALSRNLRKLRKLLNEANTYWLSGFAYTPVWLAVKGKDEAYVRYSIVTGWSYPEENNPFHPPVGGTVVLPSMNNFEIMIERRPAWTPNQPGTDTAIKAGVTQSYDGRLLGNVDDAGVADPTTAAEVFFSNKHTFTNLTDIYEDDAGGWSGNFLDLALPHRLLPDVPVAGDAIYFGIDTAVASSGPFSSLITDIKTAVTGVTGEWQYWSSVGPGWVQFGANELADNTVGFTILGVLGVFWDHPANWITANLLAEEGGTAPNITGWWVRYVVTGVASPTGGEQQNRNIYSVTWPYIEVQDDQITGELPALLRARIRNESNFSNDKAYDKYIDWLICGVRGVDRGADFTAYIPLADTQLISGQSIALGGNAAYIDDVRYSPRGRCIEFTPPAPGVSGVFTVTLDNTIANQYKGRFRMFLRTRGTLAFEVFIRTNAFGNIALTDTITIATSNELGLTDLGSINLPPAGFGNNETVEEIEFQVWATLTVGATTLKVYEIILIPVDEWVGQFYGTSNTVGNYGPMLFGTNYLDIDSTLFPKRLVYSPVRVRATDNLESQWTNINVRPFRAATERQTRLWFLTQFPDPFPFTYKWKFANHSYSENIQLYMIQQYFSSIGKNL